MLYQEPVPMGRFSKRDRAFSSSSVLAYLSQCKIGDCTGCSCCSFARCSCLMWLWSGHMRQRYELNCVVSLWLARSGYVWHEAFSGDDVCVTPQTRSQAASDNAAAAS